MAKVQDKDHVFTLVPAFKTLCEVVGEGVNSFRHAGEDVAKSKALEVLQKVSELPDEKWAALPLESQLFFDKTAEVVNNGGDPVSLIYEADQDASAAPGDHSKTKATKPAKKPVPKDKPEPVKAATAEPKPASVTAKAPTGVAKAAKPSRGGVPGGGRQRNPAMEAARTYMLLHPDTKVTELLAMLQGGDYSQIPSRGSLDSVSYEMRTALRILTEQGMIKQKGK